MHGIGFKNSQEQARYIYIYIYIYIYMHGPTLKPNLYWFTKKRYNKENFTKVLTMVLFKVSWKELNFGEENKDKVSSFLK